MFQENSKKNKPEIPNSLKIGGFIEHMNDFELSLALGELWKDFKKLDIKIGEEKPWTLPKEKAVQKLQWWSKQLKDLAFYLKPFLPETALKIEKQFSGKITFQQPLFPRIK